MVKKKISNEGIGSKKLSSSIKYCDYYIWQFNIRKDCISAMKIAIYLFMRVIVVKNIRNIKAAENGWK